MFFFFFLGKNEAGHDNFEAVDRGHALIKVAFLFAVWT